MSSKNRKKAQKSAKKYHFCSFLLKKVEKSVFFDQKLILYEIKNLTNLLLI